MKPAWACFGPAMVGVPMLATFLMRSSSGSMPIALAHMSITLSTAKCPIGEPGAR